MIGTRWQNYDFYPRPPKFLTTNVCIFQILVVILQKDNNEDFIVGQTIEGIDEEVEE